MALPLEVERQHARRYATTKLNPQALKNIKQEVLNKYNLDIIGTIIFGVLFSSAIFLDSVDIGTAGILVILGLFIIKIFHIIGMFFGILIVTGDPIRALTGRRMAINLVLGLIEMIPVINVLPLHTLAVVITVIDLKTNFLSFTKYLKTPKEEVKKYIERVNVRQ